MKTLVYFCLFLGAAYTSKVHAENCKYIKQMKIIFGDPVENSTREEILDLVMKQQGNLDRIVQEIDSLMEMRFDRPVTVTPGRVLTFVSLVVRTKNYKSDVNDVQSYKILKTDELGVLVAMIDTNINSVATSTVRNRLERLKNLMARELSRRDDPQGAMLESERNDADNEFDRLVDGLTGQQIFDADYPLGNYF